MHFFSHTNLRRNLNKNKTHFHYPMNDYRKRKKRIKVILTRKMGLNLKTFIQRAITCTRNQFRKKKWQQPLTLYTHECIHTQIHTLTYRISCFRATTHRRKRKKEKIHAFHCVIVFTEAYDGDKDKPQVQSKRWTKKKNKMAIVITPPPTTTATL